MESFVEVIQEGENIIANGDYTKILEAPVTEAFDLINGVRVTPYLNPQYIKIKMYGSGAWSKTKQFPPVTVEEGRLQVYPERLKIGQHYPISILGKEYLVHKPKEGVIDLYEVVK